MTPAERRRLLDRLRRRVNELGGLEASAALAGISRLTLIRILVDPDAPDRMYHALRWLLCGELDEGLFEVPTVSWHSRDGAA